jgi:hypothetical protein
LRYPWFATHEQRGLTRRVISGPIVNQLRERDDYLSAAAATKIEELERELDDLRRHAQRMYHEKQRLHQENIELRREAALRLLTQIRSRAIRQQIVLPPDQARLLEAMHKRQQRQRAAPADVV